MRFNYVIFADDYRLRPDGKADIVGVIGGVSAERAPIVVPDIVLVIGLTPDPEDIGRDVPFELSLTLPDRPEGLRILKTFPIPADWPVGHRMTYPAHFTSHSLSAFGDYEVHIYLDGAKVGTAVLPVTRGRPHRTTL